MSKHYRPTHDVLSSLKELLAPNPRRKAEEVLQEVVDQLQDGRGYFWVGLYLAASVPGRAEQTGAVTIIPDVSGSPTYSRGLAQSNSKLVQPIKIGTRILGAIEVESDRRQESAFLAQIAELFARYLTTDQGKLLLRKARQNSPAQAEAKPHKPPQSEYPAVSRAAAGERVIG